eukprot:3946455-Amphidinium_carterae.1
MSFAAQAEAAGFTPAQAQLVAQAVSNATQETAQRFEAERQQYQQSLAVAHQALEEERTRHHRTSTNERKQDVHFAVGKPPSLQMDGKNWEEFAFKLAAHSATFSTSCAKKMQIITENPDLVAETEVTDEKDVSDARMLFHSLVMLTVGPSLQLVRQCREQNGFEAFRLLCRRWNPSTRGRSLGRLSQILSFEFGDPSQMLDHIAQWESY